MESLWNWITDYLENWISNKSTAIQTVKEKLISFPQIIKHITGDYRRQVMIIKKLEKTRQQIFHITKPFFILTNAACKNTDFSH